MHGLPKDFDVSIFVGKTLVSLHFYEFSISMNFEDREKHPLELTRVDCVLLTLESSYSHQRSEDKLEVRIDIPTQQSTLLELVRRSVRAASAEFPGTLVLEFQGGHVLKCYDDTNMYESYHIRHDGKETHV